MVESPYEAEDLLQELLENYPQLLSGDQPDANNSTRWLLVARELGIPDDIGAADRWSLDHLFLDQDGVPTLVEVKRSSDTRIRREVVGQMLDYAANAVVFWPPDQLRARFESRCETQGKDPQSEVCKHVRDEAGSSESVERFWEQVRTNLQAKKIRLIFVADQIPGELRRIVEFLNSQMSSAEVLAIEVRQFVGGGLQTLVPHVIGQTAAAEQAKGTSQSRESWGPKTPEEFLRTAQASGKLSADQYAALKQLLDFSLNASEKIGWGSGRTPAFSPRFVTLATRSLFTANSDGWLQINLGWLNENEAEKQLRERFAEALKEIPSFAQKIKELDAFPPFDINTWWKDANRFIEVVQRLLNSVGS
jgi:hypothetical protein